MEKTYSYMKYEQLLEERKIKTVTVSRATGISTSTFSDWKSGRSVPGLEKIYKIARFFEVNMEYFVNPEIVNSDIKTRIIKLAAIKGIPIIQLEKMCGLSNGSIYHWNEVIPGVDKVLKVAKVLGVTVEELAGGIEWNIQSQ